MFVTTRNHPPVRIPSKRPRENVHKTLYSLDTQPVAAQALAHRRVFPGGNTEWLPLAPVDPGRETWGAEGMQAQMAKPDANAAEPQQELLARGRLVGGLGTSGQRQVENAAKHHELFSSQ